MIANHTSIAQLFHKTLLHYSSLRKRKAFIDNYIKEPRFAGGNLEEFDEVRMLVEQVVLDAGRIVTYNTCLS